MVLGVPILKHFRVFAEINMSTLIIKVPTTVDDKIYTILQNVFYTRCITLKTPTLEIKQCGSRGGGWLIMNCLIWIYLVSKFSYSRTSMAQTPLEP